VDDQRRQQVGFGVDQAIGVRVAHYGAPIFGRGGQPAREELRTDLLGARAQQAQADLRRSAVMGDTHRAALVIDHLDHRAGLGAGAPGDVAREDPRMAGRDAVRALAANPYRSQRIACSRAIRSSVEGCVEKSFIMTSPPVKGFTMNMWAVAGDASMG